MPPLLRLEDRLDRAAQLVVRSRIFFDIWWYFEDADTRPAIIDAMLDYNEFFRFAPHAHFVAFVVHIAALFEKRGDTINLAALSREMKAAQLLSTTAASEIDTFFAQAAPLATRVIILRAVRSRVFCVHGTYLFHGTRGGWASGVATGSESPSDLITRARKLGHPGALRRYAGAWRGRCFPAARRDERSRAQ